MRERGRIKLMAALCDDCWNVQANALAQEEGATAPPRGDPGPDDSTWAEPPTCPDCGAPVDIHRTNYDRWVRLAIGDSPAKDVPPQHRWRLVPRMARHSSYVVDLVAVRIRGIPPLPSELVRPAHAAVCPAAEAESAG